MIEVIVVDDGSPESLVPVVDAYRQLPATCVRLVRNFGRSAARNAGAERATGRRLLFLDSDSYALKGLVHGHLNFNARDGSQSEILLGRRIEPGWTLLARGRHSKVIDQSIRSHEKDVRYSLEVKYDSAFFGHHRAPWVHCFSHNLSIAKEAFIELDGFDEEYKEWGLEDLEFGYRFFTARGRRDCFTYDATAACMHLPHFRDRKRDRATLASNLRHMKRKHRNFDIELLGNDESERLPGKVKYYEDLFEVIRRGGGLGVDGAEISRVLPNLRNERVLWIGAGVGIGENQENQWRFDHLVKVSEQNLHLLGVDTTFDHGTFDTVVNLDLWRFLVPQDLSLAIIHALQLSDRLILVASKNLRRCVAAEFECAEPDYIAEAYELDRRVRKIRDEADVVILEITSP